MRPVLCEISRVLEASSFCVIARLSSLARNNAVEIQLQRPDNDKAALLRALDELVDVNNRNVRKKLFPALPNIEKYGKGKLSLAGYDEQKKNVSRSRG